MSLLTEFIEKRRHLSSNFTTMSSSVRYVFVFADYLFLHFGDAQILGL